ncbi:MAG TPA: tail fiber domain-containing protein [Thermoanaerobaculia bacterium]|nr:tail fiber domain-containing protein [Thermoanaerobaculia bacterium]
MMDRRVGRSVFACLAVAFLVAVPAMAARGPVADLGVGGASLDWTPRGSFQSMKLTVSGPGGLIIEQSFGAGQAPSLSIFDKAGQRLPDGQYRWELSAAPVLGAAAKRELAAARVNGDQRNVGGGAVQSGAFAIANGSFVADEGQTETPSPRARANGSNRIVEKDVVNADDFIVQGSTCVGLDCVNNESFGFDTVRLKENNTRIKFDDTSSSSGFPANDWQLTANDSASGGSSKFSIEDITGSKVPFTITAGASTNSIFVDSTGRVGLRTSTPVLDLHIATSNTPAMRLEQNNSGGFTAQTWDIAGNEANFFVRDVTGGSRLPFRIRPGAPTSSIDINASGNVGIGTASPSTNLHVTSSASGTTDGKVLVSNTSGTTSPRELLELNNNGGAILILKDTTVTPRWSFGTSSTSFVVDNQAHTGTEMSLDQNGNVVFSGTVTPSSSRTVKQGFDGVDPRDVLAKVANMPITTWSYKADPDVRHMGPMAEDFHSLFSVGADAKGISVTDSAGVAFAAIQGLQQELSAKNDEIGTLKQRLAALEAAVAALQK